MKRKEDIDCLNCNKPFHPKRKGNKFCCKNCAIEYNKNNNVLKKSKEQRLAISERMKGNIPHNKGKKNSDEQITKFKKSIKNTWTNEKRKQHSKKQKEIWSNPELLLKHSEDASKRMTPELKEKISQSTKRGMGRPEVKQKMIDSGMEKYGVPYYCLAEPCINSQRIISKVNKEWQKELSLPDENLETVLDSFSFDMKVDDKTLLEINPTFTHTSTPTKLYTKGKASSYHIIKTIVANKHNYRCIHVWDWDDKNKIKEMISTKETLYARRLFLKEVSVEDTHHFLNTYHLQNTCKGQTIRLGLYKDNELIQLMTFGKPRYNSKYEYELLRLCTKHRYKVVGGANKLFSHFIRNTNPTSIISYCDKSKFSGKVYLDMGFTFLKLNKPSKHWYNIKTNKHITNSLLVQRGYSQLHNGHLKNTTLTNTELMLQQGYLEVYDCGQATYIWNK